MLSADAAGKIHSYQIKCEVYEKFDENFYLDIDSGGWRNGNAGVTEEHMKRFISESIIRVLKSINTRVADENNYAEIHRKERNGFNKANERVRKDIKDLIEQFEKYETI